MPDDPITSSSVSIETLKKIFDDAAFRTSLDDKGNLWVQHDHKVVVQIHQSKRFIRFITPFYPKPEATTDSRLAFVNDWNKHTLFPRAVDDGPHIVFDFLVWLDGGISKGTLVTAFRTYVEGFRAASLRNNHMAKIFNISKPENNPPGSGTGASFETAVVVNADDTLEGVRAENAFVSGLCGQRGKDWNTVTQRLDVHNGKSYDVLTVKLSSGQVRIFYFDISRFFGK